jgi:hypothetical protein
VSRSLLKIYPRREELVRRWPIEARMTKENTLAAIFTSGIVV